MIVFESFNSHNGKSLYYLLNFSSCKSDTHVTNYKNPNTSCIVIYFSTIKNIFLIGLYYFIQLYIDHFYSMYIYY